MCVTKPLLVYVKASRCLIGYNVSTLRFAAGGYGLKCSCFRAMSWSVRGQYTVSTNEQRTFATPVFFAVEVLAEATSFGTAFSGPASPRMPLHCVADSRRHAGSMF